MPKLHLVLFFSLAHCILAQVALGQENFVPGYIISTNRDTIRGFIDFRDWENNPSAVAFKRTPDGTRETYFPGNCSGFGTPTAAYESAVVSLETGNGPELEYKSESAFLKIIFHASKSLFLYRNKEGRERFYILGDSSYELLLYKTFNTVRDGTSGIVENKRFVGQLTVYLKDCPSIQSNLKNVSYSLSSLEKVFLNYFKCTHSNVSIVLSKTQKTKVEFGVTAGYSFTMLKCSDSQAPSSILSTSSFKQSTKPTFGLIVNVVLPGNQQKLSIYNDLIYTSFEAEASRKDNIPPNSYSTTVVKLGFAYLKLATMLRYRVRLGNGGGHLFFNVGMTNGYAIEQTNYQKIERYFFGMIDGVTEGKAVEPVRSFEQGLALGLGGGFKKLSLELRVEKGNGFSGSTNLTTSLNRTYLFAGFRF